MTDILKITLVLIIIVFLLKKRWNLGLVMALSSIMLAFMYLLTPLEFWNAFYTATADKTTISLVVALTLIRIFENVMRKSGTMLIGLGRKGEPVRAYTGPETIDLAADPVIKYMSKEQMEKAIEKTRKAMEKAAAALDFIEAARLRDEIEGLRRMMHGGPTV